MQYGFPALHKLLDFLLVPGVPDGDGLVRGERGVGELPQEGGSGRSVLGAHEGVGAANIDRLQPLRGHDVLAGHALQLVVRTAAEFLAVLHRQTRQNRAVRRRVAADVDHVYVSHAPSDPQRPVDYDERGGACGALLLAQHPVSRRQDVGPGLRALRLVLAGHGRAARALLGAQRVQRLASSRRREGSVCGGGGRVVLNVERTLGSGVLYIRSGTSV